MTDIAEFGIKIEANTKALEDISKKLDDLTEKAEESSERIDKSTEKTVKKVSALAKNVAIFGSQLLFFKKIANSVFDFSTQAESIGRMAQMANVSTDSIQDLGNALKNYGGSASSASSTLAKLNKQIFDLRMGKGGALAKVVMQYGLDTSAKSPEDMLLNIAKRMQGMSALQQVNLGRALGLDEPTIMLLQQGVEGVREELEKAKKLRLFDKEDIENSRKVLRTWRELQAVLSQIAGIVLRTIQPIIARVVEYLNDIAKKIKEHPEAIKKIAIAIGGIMVLLSPLTAAFTAVALIADDIATYLKGGESYTEEILNWLQKILGCDWSTFSIGFASIKEGLNNLKEFVKQSETLQLIWEFIKGFIGGVADFVTKIVNGLGGIFAAAQIVMSGGSWSDAISAFKASIGLGGNNLVQDALNPKIASYGGSILAQADNWALNGINPNTMQISNNNSKALTNTLNIETLNLQTQATSAGSIMDGLQLELGGMIGNLGTASE